ncbi:MAG: nucleoside triphosphate pyrophosphohydrolase [Gammaproteobacteria bacterium]|nr:nucleoside triphosphate pyrophosphohydrolase [Gammaproteobacteria bacterium]MCK5091137.1 nucleoside triphosphate pyrophosphohydrolase [Gammaproteobacteria bacterium]
MYNLDDLRNIMERLRDPEHGCPWDREQTLETLVSYTLEEAYEVVDAIHRGNDQELCDELGDLLFQIIFYTQITREENKFSFDDIVDAIAIKLVRRHPHVFADEQINNAKEQTLAWEEHKEKERKEKADNKNIRASVLDGVSLALPALVRAEKLQKRASRVGFDWEDIQSVISKVEEELGEYKEECLNDTDRVKERIQEEMGDLLFSCVNLARHAGIDAESALREANLKFEGRFNAIEVALEQQGRSIEQASLEEMDRLWEKAKQVMI